MENNFSYRQVLLATMRFTFFLTSICAGVLLASTLSAQPKMTTSVVGLGGTPADSINVPWGTSLPTGAEHVGVLPKFRHPRATGYISSRLRYSLAGVAVGIVDWVFVEFRIVNEGDAPPMDPADALRLERTFALIRADGSIVNANIEDIRAPDAVLSMDGFRFDDATEDVYVVLNHNSHLGVLGGKKATIVDVDVDTGIFSYDFSSAMEQTYGDSATRLSRGVWALVVGDLDNSGEVDVADQLILQSERGRAGYWRGDTNKNAVVDIHDYAAHGTALGRVREYMEEEGPID